MEKKPLPQRKLFDEYFYFLMRYFSHVIVIYWSFKVTEKIYAKILVFILLLSLGLTLPVGKKPLETLIIYICLQLKT